MAELEVVITEEPQLDVVIHEGETPVVIPLEVAPTVVEIAVQGPAGPPGPQGTGGDLTYRHVQSVASDTWVITHGLGKYPSVSIVDTALSTVEGEVQYTSLDEVILIFSAPFSGEVFFN